MKRKAGTLGAIASTALVAVAILAATTTDAHAALVANIVTSSSTPHVGEPIVFDGSASTCDNAGGCSYQWQWFWRSTDGTTTHLGGQMGLTPVVTYAFDSFAASKPYVIVTLTVGAGRLRQPSTAQVSFVVTPATTSVGPSPTALRLAINNVPNPFRRATTIHYSLPTSSMATVTILDVGGRLVRRLAARNESSGAHSVFWNGSTETGNAVKAGVYFARVETPYGAASHRLTITN